MATVTILALGHALVDGARGDQGGAPSKNSIWGIATVDNVLVTFSGRMGAKILRYKEYPHTDKDKVMQMFEEKKSGKGMEYRYVDITSAHEEEVPGLIRQINIGYFQAVAENKVNRRAM